MVTAGIGDHTAFDFRRGELENLVGGAADFECTDGLQRLGLEVDFFRSAVTGEPGKLCANERSLDGYVGDAVGGGADFFDGDEGFWHVL